MKIVRALKRVFRVSTLVVPSWAAWFVAFSESEANQRDALAEVVATVLEPLWMLVILALAARFLLAALDPKRDPARPPVAQIDVLTSSGAALGWLSALAIASAVWLGWASLVVVGLLGTALFHLQVLRAFVSLRRDPTKGAVVSRKFLPGGIVEGDEVVEEIRLSGVRVPIGYRLFITGRVGPRWSTCRHVVEAAESGAEVVLESEVGPAVRGEHDAEPLSMWLEDTFGLCRSPISALAAAHVSVLPRTRVVEKAVLLMDGGLASDTSRPDARLPTEGLFNLREYQPGDDVRRIHWVRSLASRELVVRLPDEIPPDRPRVRLVLDTFFPGVQAFHCDAPSELLDSLVSTWLAVGQGLVAAGARVTLVTAVDAGSDVQVVRRALTSQSVGDALRLGAKVTWQDKLTVDALLTEEATFVVARGVLTNPPARGNVRWILGAPLIAEPSAKSISGACHTFPIGSTDNRLSRRRRAVQELSRARMDHAQAMSSMWLNVAAPPLGSFAAAPTATGSIRLEALR